jgi:hypothetical protein
MVISPGARRLLVAVHVTCSIGWVGVVLAYIVLGIAAERGDPETLTGAWIAMEVLGWHVLLPLAVNSWGTGILLALGTKWGFLRHYWVVASLAATSLALCLMAVHLPRVSAIADTVRAADPPTKDYGGDLVHSVLALALLLAVQYLNVYKPAGLTPYGARKVAEASAPAPGGRASPEPAPTPTTRPSR